MRSTHVLLVRHGHVDIRGTMCGQTDVPLSPVGVQQARAVAHHLRGLRVVYASALRRARETARAVADDVRAAPAIGEISCGALDGVAFERIRAAYPELWAANEAQADDDFRWPGGESYRELRARSVRALTALAAAHPGERIVVVTHAGVISQLLGHIHGTPPARWSMFRVGNASVTELAWCGDRGAVHAFDDRTHLPAALQT